MPARFRVDALLKADDDVFCRAVDDYVLGAQAPTPDDHAVFRSPELVERTYKALSTLIQNCITDMEKAGRDSPEYWAARDDQSKLTAERHDLGPIIKQVRDQRTKELNLGLERRALRKLAQQYPKEYLAIKRQMKREMKEAQAAEQAAEQEQPGQ